MLPRFTLQLLASTVALVPLAATAAPPAPATATDGPTIIVTARTLQQTAADLAACLARNCPPDEDVRASLAHADNQFVSGGYKDARTTLLKSVGRNRRHGAQFAVPVSDLLRANARVAAHLGEGGDYQSSTIASRDILKAAYGPDDARTLVGQVEVADMRARLGYGTEAERSYRAIAERARRLNLGYIAGAADIRAASIKLASDIDDDKREGRARLERFATTGTDASTRLAARVLLARLDRKAGKQDTTKALLAEYAKLGGTQQPMLLSAEPIVQPSNAYGGDLGRGTSNVLSMMATKDFDGQWFDVGFWVAPDGRPSDIEIIRKNGSEPGWEKPVVASIATRIYAPLKREAGDPGVYMLERYSLTSLWEDRLGTRIRQRSALPRIERLDLTAEQIAASTATSGG